MAYYVDAFSRAITPRTKVMCFTHLSSTVGDLMPAKELCRVARERGVLTLARRRAESSACSTSTSAEIAAGLLFRQRAQMAVRGARVRRALRQRARCRPQLWPSIYSAYPGATGFSRTFEGFGQRDEATMIAFRAALEFQDKVGPPAIEARARELTHAADGRV